MSGKSYVLQGNICYSKTQTELNCVQGGYLVCENGLSLGVFEQLPERYAQLPLFSWGDALILPGLCDMHVHAPQFAFRTLGMDLELLDWLNAYAFPEEQKYASLDYAALAYADFVKHIKHGPNTRACVYATVHRPATQLLMDLLENSGLVTMVGKVNMDRNSASGLQEASAEHSAKTTIEWLQDISGRYKNTAPILTPRFLPSCSDELMQKLADIQRSYKLPVQSHLSENQGEIEWVKQLCPTAKNYSDAYHNFGLFGGDVPTIMAHCIWLSEQEIQLMASQKVLAAHCPQSNMNLSSGIAPVRRLLEAGVPVGLGSDVAGGCHSSLFRAMGDAIQVSKLYWRLIGESAAPLTLAEAFYLATLGGGQFFGRVGSFDEGYELDALVIDDSHLQPPFELTLPERLARVVYLSQSSDIKAKYVRGRNIL